MVMMMVHFPCARQPGHPCLHLIQALLMLLLLLLDQSWSTVPLSRFAALASPRLVLVVRVVFLVLHPQPLGLLDEGTLLRFREKSEEERRELLDQYQQKHWLITYVICSVFSLVKHKL